VKIKGCFTWWFACCWLAGVAAAQGKSCRDIERPVQDPAVSPRLTAIQRLLATDDVDRALALVTRDIADHPEDSLRSAQNDRGMVEVLREVL
jgi:hypothetical protein